MKDKSEHVSFRRAPGAPLRPQRDSATAHAAQQPNMFPPSASPSGLGTLAEDFRGTA